jgi:hypothetical protein
VSETKTILVPNLRIEIITGSTCYVGENGFSSFTAYVTHCDDETYNLLREVHQNQKEVTVKCAGVEIDGRVGNLKADLGEDKLAIAISVTALRYLKSREE